MRFVWYELLLLLFLLLLQYFIERRAPVRRIPATRTSPFSIRSYRAATADRRLDCSQRSYTSTSTHTFIATGFAYHYIVIIIIIIVVINIYFTTVL